MEIYDLKLKVKVFILILLYVKWVYNGRNIKEGYMMREFIGGLNSSYGVCWDDVVKKWI